MPIFLAAAASSGASPAPVLDWVDTISVDYPIGGLSYIPGFDTTLGTLFTTTAGGLCTGIRMRLGTQNGINPNTLQFALFAIGGPLLSQETIQFNPSMYGQIVQTTGAFSPLVNLQPNTQYIAAVFIDGPNGPYNYAPVVPVGYLPKNFPKYTINVGSQSASNVGLNYPANNNPNYANYIEPLIA